MATTRNISVHRVSKYARMKILLVRNSYNCLDHSDIRGLQVALIWRIQDGLSTEDHSTVGLFIDKCKTWIETRRYDLPETRRPGRNLQVYELAEIATCRPPALRKGCRGTHHSEKVSQMVGACIRRSMAVTTAVLIVGNGHDYVNKAFEQSSSATGGTVSVRIRM